VDACAWWFTWVEMITTNKIVTNIYRKWEITETVQQSQKMRTRNPSKLFHKLDSRIGVERSETKAWALNLFKPVWALKAYGSSAQTRS
jgi:hypothetical protein